MPTQQHHHDSRASWAHRYASRLPAGLAALAIAAAGLGAVPLPGQNLRPAWATTVTGGVLAQPARSVPSFGAAPSTTTVPASRASAEPTSARSASVKRASVKSGKGGKPAGPTAEPVSVIRSLIGQIDAEEGQITSLDAYVEARSFLRRAVTRLATANRALQQSLRQVKLAKAQLVSAKMAEAVALRLVDLYEGALSELGVQEYTGQAGADGADLQQVEYQVEMSQLGSIAASDTSTSLETAESVLVRAEARVLVDQTRLVRAVVAAKRAKARDVAAQVQAKACREAFAKAKTWATVAGTAPPEPLQALLALEGPFGKSGAIKHPSRSERRARHDGSRPVPLPRAKRLSLSGPPSSRPANAKAGPGGSPSEAGPRTTAQVLGTLGPTIMGPSVLSAQQLAAWFASTGSRARTSVPIAKLAADYIKVGGTSGVRADIAFAQSIVETAYFSFPGFGQDSANYNNFAGIGACDSCKHGWKFPTATDGVTVQLKLLALYATPPKILGAGLVPALGVGGCCRTWMALSGVWASNPNYGYEILSIYNEMLNWVLQSELLKAGLATPVAIWQAG